ncbi:MAG: hypothetical protein HC875_29225 [Anaerolineales bacterium]|nr:hypothetical protein [Anaerolineales bacterium]
MMILLVVPWPTDREKMGGFMKIRHLISISLALATIINLILSNPAHAQTGCGEWNPEYNDTIWFRGNGTDQTGWTNSAALSYTNTWSPALLTPPGAPANPPYSALRVVGSGGTFDSSYSTSIPSDGVVFAASFHIGRSGGVTTVYEYQIIIHYSDATSDSLTGTTVNSWQSLEIEADPGKTITGLEWKYQHISGSSNVAAHVFNVRLSIPCETEPPQDEILCPLVQNSNFGAADGWNLVGISEISGGYLTMAGIGAASQNVTVQPLVTYNSVISVTQATSATLGVSLGSQGEVLTVERGTYTSTFTTPGVIGGPLEYLIENQSANSIQINFACIQLADGTGDRVCIAPDNGTFDTAADWGFYRGASHNAGAQDAKLPFNEGGDKALIQATSFYTFPTLAEGEYLIASFDARANGESATVANRIGYTFASSHVSEFVAFQEVYNQTYTFEFDISFLAEEYQNSVSFANPGAEGSEDDLYVDNVCIFVSTQPPQLPSPSDPNAPPTVDLGEFYGCGDVDGILYGLIGVDLRYHRAVYAETPGFLDFSDWVPWLVAAFWMGVNVYLCVVMVLIQTFLNFVEYVANNRLNILTWVLNSSINFIAWLGLWLTNNLETFGNAVEASLETAENWLEWAALVALAFSVFPVSFFALLFVAMLWVFGGFFYVGEFLENYFPWLSAQLTNVERDLFNRFVILWNLFLANLGPALSEVVNGIISIWNVAAAPFLGLLLGVLSIPLAISYVIVLVLSVALWLWENVFQIIIMPIAFYRGLMDGMQSNAFGNLLDCTAPGDFWCAYLAGVDLSNSVASASYFYPIIIIGIIIGTLVILRRHGGAGWEKIIDAIMKF